MKKFIITFHYTSNVINLEFMLKLCNCEYINLVRVFINEHRKIIKLYVELLDNENLIFDIVNTFSIYKCDINDTNEKDLLSELKEKDVFIFDMKYKYDFYNIYMLKNIVAYEEG